MINTISLLKRFHPPVSLETYWIILRERIILNPKKILPFASTNQRCGVSIYIPSILNQSLQKLIVSLFNLYQSLGEICLSFSQKYQTHCKTNQSSQKRNQTPQKRNQSQQNGIKKQWVLIRFCDFQLKLSKNNSKSEGLN